MITRIREALTRFGRDWWQWLRDQPRWFLAAPAAVVTLLWALLWWLS